VSFASITLCVASQRVFVVISLSTQSGNIWVHTIHCCFTWNRSRADSLRQVIELIFQVLIGGLYPEVSGLSR
jgi:hypothetical protein